MPKIVWVALPLLAAGLWLAVQALRGRSPSRQALNIGSSLLLIAYVATTAGLGIFWVANQQLPVFDWHYLFGYTTALLVVLHLSFNLRIVWRYLTRSSGTAAVAADAQAAGVANPLRGRRRLIGVAGALAAAAAAFVLGLRHGRSELRINWPQPLGANTGAAPAAPDAALAFVDRFHAFSSTSRSGVLLRAPSLDWGSPPPPFKRYTGVPQPLPPPRTATGARLDRAALGAVLWHTAGVTASLATIKLRAAPSSGALFSTELYVAVRQLPDLAPGLWHYDAQAHALHRLTTQAATDDALGVPDGATLRGAAALVIATAVFGRTGHKYRDRTYRYVLADLGHALENLRVAAGAVGAQARLLDRFDEARAAGALGVDEAEEGVLALVALQDRAAGAAAAAAPAAPLVPTAAPWRTPPAPADASGPLGVTSAVHRASSLRAATPLPQASTPSAANTVPSAIALPQVTAVTANRLDVIAARRSVRRFASTPLPLEALAGVLHGIAGGTVQLSYAVRVYVVAHAVAGLAPGAYRYEAGAHALTRRRPAAELRADARAAALDQDVIGDAAAVFVLAIDRAAFAADPAGPARGYRHAFIEAGLIGERVYLEAGARGLGACAVGAFYDDQAAALVAIDTAREWVVHFAALGVPSR